MGKYCSENVKMNLDNLPRCESGRHKGEINWRNSVGYIVKAECEGVIYNIKITKYNKGYLNVKIDDEEVENPIHSNNLKNGKIGSLIGKIIHEYIYNVGEIIKDEKRDLIILEQIKKKHGSHNVKGYRYRCNKDGYEGEISEDDLKKGKGCRVCGGKEIMPGVNTIWDTDKWAVDRGLISEEDAKKYSRNSHKRIDVVCLNCGEIKKNIRVYSIINNKSIGCKKCGDGVSFPEKVVGLVLDKLNIYYEKQKSFSWSQDRIYDFFIPSLGKLIETHGMQHYEEVGWGKYGGRTLAEEQENDRLKEELAIKNGLKYMPIDCRESNIDFIKENIVKTLGNNIDFSSINWEEIDKEAQSSLVWEVCEYWKNKKGEETVKDLAKYFGLSKATIIKYLKKGNKYDWCFYDAKEEMIKRGKEIGNNTAINKSKKVAVYKDGKLKDIYSSIHDLERKSEQDFGIKFDSSNISAVCHGRLKTHKGYAFKFLK